jgi:predicted small integral membrane protein
MADAGWYPDPRGRHEHRYFDGTTWTDHVADNGRGSMDPVNAPSPPSGPPLARSTDAPPPPPGASPTSVGSLPPAAGAPPTTERTPGWYPEPIPMPAGGRRASPRSFNRPRRAKRAVNDVREYSMAAKALVFGGAIALVGGALLPWVRANAGFVTVEQSGIDITEGALTLLCGIAAAVLFWVVVSQAGRLFALLAGAFALVISGYKVFDISGKGGEVSTATGVFRVETTVGLGLWISLIAAIAVVVGAVLALREAR